MLAVLSQLRPGALVLAQLGKQGGGVLPFKAFFHILGGDDRVIIIRDDTARHLSHFTQMPGAPPAEGHEGSDEHQIPAQQFGLQTHTMRLSTWAMSLVLPPLQEQAQF